MKEFLCLCCSKSWKCYWKERNVTERREIALKLFHKHFCMFMNMDTPTLRATWVNQVYPFMSLVYTLQTTQIMYFTQNFAYWTFWDIYSTTPIYFTNRSYNIACCITIIGPFSHAYIKNLLDVLALALRLLISLRKCYIIAVTWALVICMPKVRGRGQRTTGIHFRQITCYNYKIFVQAT